MSHLKTLIIKGVKLTDKKSLFLREFGKDQEVIQQGSIPIPIFFKYSLLLAAVPAIPSHRLQLYPVDAVFVLEGDILTPKFFITLLSSLFHSFEPPLR